MNEQIRVPEVRLIGADGSQVGVVSTPEARRMAEAEGLDLVEIVPTSSPPVCRIMDFGKFQYEQSKKRHAAKRKQKQIQIKEIKFRPGTGIGDYQIKLRNLIKFLEAGDKAKITLRFRGREMAHQELGMQLLRRIEVDLKNYGTVEQHARMEGRQMVMMVAPDRKVASGSGSVGNKGAAGDQKPAAEPKAAVKQTVAG